jgi:ribosomal protein S18 acetylase RimI-like enzyme
MAIASRALASEEDYALVRAMLVEIAADRSRAHYCTIGDLDWWRSTEEDPENIRLMRIWLDDERAVAIAWPDNKSRVDAIVHPDHSELLPNMLSWAEEQTLKAGDGSAVTLETWSCTRDDVRNEALGECGYEQGQPAFRQFALNLSGNERSPSLPAGYILRDMREATAEDIQRRVDVHRAAFAPSEMTFAKYQRVMTSPTYRPELDIVIRTDDESFAAFTIVWFDEANQIGLFEPVGTHPDHQRRGLGRAIMAEGLRQLNALGATRALVSTGPDNLEANGLYKSAGFQVVDENVSWTKRLR